MKRTLTAGAILICAPFILANAQILDTHPAGNPGGAMLNYEDVTISAKTRPDNARYYWTDNGELTTQRPSSRKTWTLPSSDDPAISYGTSVSRNEFGIDGGVFPSPSGSMLAVYRKDESAVTTFPLLDIGSRTGSLREIRYPMNGMASEKLELCICDTLGNIISHIVPEEYTDERYLTCVSWSPDEQYVFIQVLSRTQHDMCLNMYRAADGGFIRTILQEHNDAWVEPYAPLHFIDSKLFIYSSDNRDGYRNLYLCDTEGSLVRRIPTAAADVEYAGIGKTQKGIYIYYTSCETSAVENQLFRIEADKLVSVSKARFGKPQRLTPERGTHSISFSPDMSRFIDRWSSFNVPGVTSLREADGTLVKVLSESKDPLAGYAECEVELGTVRSADGQYDNWYRLFKPLGFDPTKKYPLIVYVYGGPHSQMVTDSWLGNIRLWEMLMAQRGYAVYVQDNRGTRGHGTAYEKAINRACGQVEMADQKAGLDSLLERCPWIDRDRIGVHGWSYGGFMTCSLATTYPEVFKVAVAGGPVIDWKWYEVMYGERYMDTPDTNPEGFSQTSLMGKADRINGKLLICQGAVDPTVVWEHSLSFLQECIEKDKQVDYFPYPCSEHNMSGKARVHLYHKITEYFERNL